MINRINKMLRQQEGFTLMELMIVIVIIGILAGIAVPVYKGVQNSTRQKVGEANAEMLNRTIRTMLALEVITDYSVEEHQDDLLEYMGLDEVLYVAIMAEPKPEINKWYEGVPDADAKILVTPST